jgi:eukaryotic-like serine/threonine-protein kinase
LRVVPLFFSSRMTSQPDLVGRETPVGPVPKSLRPIFRDREDFAAGHSLTQLTIAALEAAQFLIVICSPHAAQSKYVNEEVRRFKVLGRAEKVLALIVEGRPDDPVRECFPRALRHQVGSDGEITDAQEHPIAADARPQGDGKQIALQKIVAGLLGVGLDEIVRRAERARKRRNRVWAALAGIFLLLAVAATGSAVARSVGVLHHDGRCAHGAGRLGERASELPLGPGHI